MLSRKFKRTMKNLGDKISDTASSIDTSKIVDATKAGLKKAGDVASDIKDAAENKATEVKLKTAEMVRSKPLTLDKAKEELLDDLNQALCIFDEIPLKEGVIADRVQEEIVVLAMQKLVDSFEESVEAEVDETEEQTE